MRYVFIAFGLGCTLVGFGQRFGGHPPSVKWRQVNTDTARIIFPAGLDSQAQRTASIVHYLAAQNPVSLGQQLQKIDIVLQNQTTVPNAYVGMGPFRSEFFLTPAFNNFDQGTIPWNDQLALHEYRHVQQFNNFDVGLSHAMRILFGQEGYSLAVNAAIPDWYYEGDAVYSETVLSAQARGRLPLFLNAYPALWRAGKNYSWMKLRNGSFKDYVPNHYYLGYLLVNYGREKYGLDFWTKVTKDAAAFKGLLYPFQKAIRKYAGVDYKTFCKDAFDFYRRLDAAQSKDRADALAGEAVFPVNKKVVTNYMFPYSVSGDSLLYLKTAYNLRPGFYLKDADGEHRLRTKDIAIDGQFSYRNGKVVYAAYETHPRWSWWDYSVVKVWDVKTNEQRSIGRRTRYFTPDISPSGDKVVAVHASATGKSELHILDVATGNIDLRLRSGDIGLFTDPKFIDGKRLVCAVRLKDGKSALALADLTSGAIERLTPPSFNAVGYPSVAGDLIYFTASFGGADNLYALRLADRKLFRVSDDILGNYFVNVAHGKVTWSTFTAEGYQLRQTDEKDLKLTPVPTAVLENLDVKFAVSHDEQVRDILRNPGLAREFPVKEYPRSTRLFNFHSWRPYYEDPIFTFSLYGENVLNTLQTEIYYLYNQNDRTNAVGLTAVYGQWFPYLSIGSQLTFAFQDSVGSLLKQWNQLDTRVGVNVPLNFTKGRMYKSFNVGTNYYLTNQFLTGPAKNQLEAFNYTSLQHYASWSEQAQMARQHIFPRPAYSVSVSHRYAVTNVEGYQFYAAGALYLPGVFPSHNIVFSGAYQQRDTMRALFSNRLADARGYVSYYRTIVGSRTWRFSANYHFPIWLPDWGFGNILYLQRFRGNLFYDAQKLYFNNKTFFNNLRSIGAELYVDTKWWNQYELTFGIRVSHLLDDDILARMGKGSNVFEFILPVSIIPR